MDYQVTFKPILLAVLFFLSGFFSCSEAALFSLTPLHLHKMAEDRISFLANIHKLLRYPRRLLITIIVGNEAVNITISALAASLFLSFFPSHGEWLAIAVTTPLLLIFGEALPKTFAVTYPMRFSSACSPALLFFSRLERPVVWILERISGWVVTLFSKSHPQRDAVLMEEEFRSLVDAGEEEGALEGTQRDLIHRVFDLGDKPVSEIMIPRVDMFCLPLNMDMAEMEKQVVAARHSRIPVYGTDRDDILGIMFAKDLLNAVLVREQTVHVEKLLRRPYFVPEGKSVGSLLRDFQSRKLQMAIAVDEYGGVSGLVTIEDILEDLFGDLYERLGVKERLWERIDAKTMIVSGSLAMDNFRSLVDIDVPPDEFETVGGFVFHLFGRLPGRGEEIGFGGYTFRVDMMGRARILTIRVEKGEAREDG